MSSASMIAKYGKTADVEELSTTKDALGAAVQQWTIAHADIPCWKQPASASQIQQWMARKMRVTHVVFFLQDIRSAAITRIRMEHSEYLVHGVIDEAGIGRIWSVYVEELL